MHNRNEIQKFGGHEIEPDAWAKEFDEFITKELQDKSSTKYLDGLIAEHDYSLFLYSTPYF